MMMPVHVVQASSRAAATFFASSSRTHPRTFPLLPLLFSRARGAPLHSSAVLGVESARKRQARLTRQKNLAKREELLRKAAAQRPHVILGIVHAEAEAKWAACELARVLVRPEELAPDAPAQHVSLPSSSSSSPSTATTTTTTMEGEEVEGAAEAQVQVEVPPALAFGIREREREMLFEHLPLLSADMSTRREMNASSSWMSSGGLKKAEEMATHHEAEMGAGVAQANVLAKLVDLRNANAAGIAFENRRRVVAAFSEPGNPNDTGRTEVQAALLTLQIRNLWNHLNQFKKDVASRRSLRRLVHQRAKLLKYLKRTNRDRYEQVLERLGLERGAVEGELVV
ncbi:hypothetical protein BC827DRAFT_536378 [Russula dissimulans]|nr:hypothetical protein BC827DRAFT_536378 [Russula dissimulans]